MAGRSRVRAAATAGIAAAGLTAALVLPVRVTEAAWTRTEVPQGAVAAVTMVKPAAQPPCTLSPGTLGLDPVITVKWKMPAGVTLPPDTVVEYGYSPTGGLEVITGGLLSSVSTSAPVAGVYTTTFNSGLLAGLLGGSKSVGIRFKGPNSWYSPWTQADASMGLAGANPQCVLVP